MRCAWKHIRSGFFMYEIFTLYTMLAINFTFARKLTKQLTWNTDTPHWYISCITFSSTHGLRRSLYGFLIKWAKTTIGQNHCAPCSPSDRLHISCGVFVHVSMCEQAQIILLRWAERRKKSTKNKQEAKNTNWVSNFYDQCNGFYRLLFGASIYQPIEHRVILYSFNQNNRRTMHIPSR